MRILVLSHFYAPEPIPKPSDLAEELRRRGHGVAVITNFPNYPSGRVYPGYRLALLRREVHSGVPVLRTWVWPSHGTSRLGRIANYGSAMLSAVLGGLAAPPADVIYAFHPPLTIGVAAWIIARIKRARMVLDVQDIWPESIVTAGMLSSRWGIGLLHALERFVYRRAARLLVVTEHARTNLVTKGVPAAKIEVMPHWIDEGAFEEIAPSAASRVRAEMGWGDRFVVMYAGNLGLLQGLDVILDAAAALRDTPAVFALVGDGADRTRLQRRAGSLGLDNVSFVDRQAAEAMLRFYAAANALVVHLKRSGVSAFVIPTKTIACLAAGRPILMAMEGPSAELIERAGAGLVIPAEDPAALAGAVRHLMTMPPAAREALGAAGRAFARTHFARSRVISLYEDVLGRAAAPPDAGRPLHHLS